MERYEAYQEALKILYAQLEHTQLDHAPNGADACAIAEFLTTLTYHLERIDCFDTTLYMPPSEDTTRIKPCMPPQQE